MVSALTIGNMRRAPNRSVRAPTGILPIDPTSTGTATRNACWNALRSSSSRYAVPSGLISAHAQKLTRNPVVARASIRGAGAPPVIGVKVDGPGASLPGDGCCPDLVVVMQTPVSERDVMRSRVMGSAWR